MRFIITKELGKLARWLRIIGFDTIYCKNVDSGALIIQALRDDRTIVTRCKNTHHLERCTVVVNSNRLSYQLKELIEQLNLQIDEKTMFTRCTLCNGVLGSVNKEEVKEKIPQHVYGSQGKFTRCSDCHKIYWQGSHWGNVNEVITKLSIQN